MVNVFGLGQNNKHVPENILSKVNKGMSLLKLELYKW